jgi:hypothetical protein
MAARFTPELRARAREAKAAKRQARERSGLRRDYADALEWGRLASARGLRLPPWGEPVTRTIMERWLRKLGLAVRDYLAWAGEADLRTFAERNPEWPARAWCGLVLEGVDIISRRREPQPEVARRAA